VSGEQFGGTLSVTSAATRARALLAPTFVISTGATASYWLLIPRMELSLLENAPDEQTVPFKRAKK
jgi:hypothetical protein